VDHNTNPPRTYSGARSGELSSRAYLYTSPDGTHGNHHIGSFYLSTSGEAAKDEQQDH
jgi:hypothetical protein